MEPTPIRLTLVQPNLPQTKFESAGPLITLGRAADCTVPIKDRFLSRRHAEIVFDGGRWVVNDCGSVNGTLLNGSRVNGPVPLRPGDRIILGDSEVLFEPQEAVSQSQLIAVDSLAHAKSIVIPVRDTGGDARTGLLTSLALQFIEERPMSELFDFILERVVEHLNPSRAAVALLGSDGKSFDNVRIRRRDESDSSDLLLSRTLLSEVIEGRSVVSFFESSQNDRLARAESIVAQSIRAAVCAPLVVGDDVLGVLYLDFQAARGAVSEEDVRLIGQIARFGAVKLETTRLREESIAKSKLEQELRTASDIQSRLLPAELPSTDSYTFAASSKPCRTVSGDYYDVVVRPNGRIYFIMADVSGKGITAALVMASVATAFSIFTRNDPSAADLVRDLNVTLAPKTSPSKFVTMVVGVLDPATGEIEFANAGHVPPLVVTPQGVEQLKSTDLVVGLFSGAAYRNQQTTLSRGDSLVLFTDGVSEAENAAEDQLGVEPIAALLASMERPSASTILEAIDSCVASFSENAPAADDVTMLALTRL